MAERTLLFDGDCGFCTRTVQWALDHARAPFAAVPFQATDPTRYGITIADARRSVWWIEGDRRLHGEQAVAAVLRACGAPWSDVGRAMRTPPLRWVAALGYRAVARLRQRLPGTRPACDGAWDAWRGRPDARPARSDDAAVHA
jgi:predicted DCC family thiol-disulfide oxidoreductase YuxK